MNSAYYSADTHRYMQYQNDRLADYLYTLLPLDSLKHLDNAIELGAGMGRFSAPLIREFKTVTLVEPEPSFANVLRHKFAGAAVSVVEAGASTFIEQSAPRASAVFSFHLMHHLKSEDRLEIFEFVRNTNSIGLIVEPNPINPLILIQVLCHPDMKFSEEKQYLQLGYRQYAREMGQVSLKPLFYKRVLFLPPFLSNVLVQRASGKAIRWMEHLNAPLPMFSSYQVLLYGA